MMGAFRCLYGDPYKNKTLPLFFCSSMLRQEEGLRPGKYMEEVNKCKKINRYTVAIKNEN